LRISVSRRGERRWQQGDQGVTGVAKKRALK
jgi:hypothetical protein